MVPLPFEANREAAAFFDGIAQFYRNAYLRSGTLAGRDPTLSMYTYGDGLITTCATRLTAASAPGSW